MNKFIHKIIISLLNWIIEGDYSKWVKLVEWIDLEIKWWKNLNCLKMKDRDEKGVPKIDFYSQPAKKWS